jgi:hypothetical protein
VNQSRNGSIRSLEPLWDERVFDLAATQKSGDTQYGSVSVPAADGGMRATLGYRRYFDCDATDTAGQDYAVARGDQQYLVGVLADGVGQSFYGDLAAERVGTRLLRQLWEQRTSPPDNVQLESDLRQAEHEFSEVIAKVSLDHLPEWQRPALEATRRAGSQSVFAAFIWDFVRQNGYLYQVGDITALVTRNGVLTKVQSEPRGRWSSAGKSQLHLLVTPLELVTGILLKTDGADPAWGNQIEAETADTASFAAMAATRAANDDVSFVAGCLVTGGKSPRRTLTAYIERPPTQEPDVSVYAGMGTQKSEVRRQESGVRSQEPGDRRHQLTRQPGPAPPTFSGLGTGASRPRTRIANSLFFAGGAAVVLLVAFVIVVMKHRFHPAQSEVKAVSSGTASSKQHAAPKGPSAATAATTAHDSESELEARAAIPDEFAKTVLAARPDTVVLRIRGNPPYAGLSLKGTEVSRAAGSAILKNEDSWYVALPQSGLNTRIYLELIPTKGKVIKGSFEIAGGKGCYDISVPAAGKENQ